MAAMTGMIRIVFALATAALVLPSAVRAAELRVTGLHQRVVHRVHRLHGYVARQHFGYYFGRWGWRSGGTASSWYDSTFVLAGDPWQGPAIVLKASPRRFASIYCPERRPDACLAEPSLAPVTAVGPPIWR
jgi:hypothetical protein